jgi:L-iditol 2-dehydrogenase
MGLRKRFVMAKNNSSAAVMKAAVLHAKNDLRYEDYPMPDIQPGTVKVRVRSSGICGSDIPRVLEDAAFFYPIVLGHEFSGEVVEVGEGVASLKEGDRISGAALLPCYNCDDCWRGNYALCRNYSFVGSRRQGSFADYVVLPESNAVKCDPAISYDEAAMFEPCTVAMHGVRMTDFRGGEDVAILGSGTIGIFTMQVVKIFGAKRVTLFDISDERLALAKKLGADATINTASGRFPEEAADLTGGVGYKYVFEVAGQPAAMHRAFELAASRATLCFIGYPHVPVTFSAALWENLNRKELKIIGTRMSYGPPFPGPDWTLTAHYMAKGQLHIDPSMIFRRFPVSRAAEAFELFRDAQAVKGKILLIND